MRTTIYPNDTVRHKPTGEEWTVAGVNHKNGTLIPCGHPFPTIAKIEDCELIKEGYESKSQSAELIKEFLRLGMQNYVDTRSAMWHEYLLYMYRGKLLPIAAETRGKFHTVFRERAQRHSQKPDISYEIIDRLYPNAKKLEMYARVEREGYDSFGNEVKQ